VTSSFATLTLHILSQMSVICLSVKMGLLSATLWANRAAPGEPGVAALPAKMLAAALTAVASSIMGSGLEGADEGPGEARLGGVPATAVDVGALASFLAS